MPRPRARPPREPCDCLDCLDRPPTSLQSQGGAARQDPPPKSCIVFLANAACAPEGGALAEVQAPHMDAVVREGYSGLLAFRSQPGPGELEQLLGLPASTSLAERFMDLRAVMLASGPEAAGAGRAAGCHGVRQLSEAEVLEPRRAAEHVLRVLGMQAAPGGAAAAPSASGEAEEDNDMALLALDAQGLAAVRQQESPAQEGAGDQEAASAALEWVDALVRALNLAPGFRETVLLTLVLGPGPGGLAAPLLLEDPPLIEPLSGTLVADGKLAAAPAEDFPPIRRPLQSYQFSGARRVAVDGCRPALVVHRLAGVVRRDGAARLAEAAGCGGGGAILAEHLLPEVAYKLGRVPKYGA